MRVREADVHRALDLFPGFLNFGTLLGAVRDGGLIPWDNDVDIGFLAEDAPPQPSNVYRKARLDGFARRHGVTRPNFGVLVGETRVGVQILHDGSDGFHYHTELRGRLVRVPSAYVESFTTINFLGREVSIPERPERLLDWYYGDWRTPDKKYARSEGYNRRRDEWLVG